MHEATNKMPGFDADFVGQLLMKKIALAAAAVIMMTGAATAADMAPRYTKAPIAAPVVAYSWTGCHVGVNGGALLNDSHVDVRYADVEIPSPNLLPLLAHGYNVDQTAGTAGAQVGCDWQTGLWVFGVEGDANWSGLNSRTFTSFPEILPPPAGVAGFGFVQRDETFTQKIDWFATVRGRAGFTIADSWLVYATGGIAFANVDSSLFVQGVIPGIAAAASPRWAGSLSENRVGWTAGAGVEHYFSRSWSAKAEYLYVDLGTSTIHALDLAAPLLTVNHFVGDVHTRFHVLRVGLNYHFNQPIVAKY